MREDGEIVHTISSPSSSSSSSLSLSSAYTFRLILTLVICSSGLTSADIQISRDQTRRHRWTADGSEVDLMFPREFASDLNHVFAYQHVFPRTSMVADDVLPIFEQVKTLWIRNTNLASIDAGALLKFSQLGVRNFWFSGNKLKRLTVPPGFVADLLQVDQHLSLKFVNITGAAIAHINLQDNNLRKLQIDESTVNQTRQILLQKNKFLCRCGLVPLILEYRRATAKFFDKPDNPLTCLNTRQGKSEPVSFRNYSATDEFEKVVRHCRTPNATEIPWTTKPPTSTPTTDTTTTESTIQRIENTTSSTITTAETTTEEEFVKQTTSSTQSNSGSSAVAAISQSQLGGVTSERGTSLAPPSTAKPVSQEVVTSSAADSQSSLSTTAAVLVTVLQTVAALTTRRRDDLTSTAASLSSSPSSTTGYLSRSRVHVSRSIAPRPTPYMPITPSVLTQ